MPYRVVSFDFDHTLTAGFTAIEHLASFLGIEKQIIEVEAEFRAGRLDTYGFSDRTAGLFRGAGQHAVAEHMRTIPLVDGIPEMVRQLKERGLRVIINTVGYRPLLEALGGQLGVDEVSGVTLHVEETVFSGKVIAYFPLAEKVVFARQQAAKVGGTLADVIAVGDGLSDVPLFDAVGASIAFNADAATRARATLSAEGTNCEDLFAKLTLLLDRRDEEERAGRVAGK